MRREGRGMVAVRTVVQQHAGTRHGPITRVIDPAGLGEQLKPFIFLDFFSAPVTKGFGFPMHPHSGIATLTWQPDCNIRYEDTLGSDGVLPAGGLEWMNAGIGAWHRASFDDVAVATGFQLWVPMPPEIEGEDASAQYVPPEQVPVLRQEGVEIRLLLGALVLDTASGSSPIIAHHDMNYFVLTLHPNSAWRYVPPPSHSVAWAFPFDGEARVAGVCASQRLLQLSDHGVIDFASGSQAARILVGSARPHDYPLVLGPHSVHTSETTLARGLQQIRRVGESLKQQGRL